MKSYKQVHLIAKDRSFKYEPIANAPEFNDLNSALAYWKYNKDEIEDCNFYKDPIVIIRREIHTVIERELSL
tara:strand:- start:3553 stop:3768 length:216 start_codon:yes stop_codon:yes gene_type:complete